MGSNGGDIKWALEISKWWSIEQSSYIIINYYIKDILYFLEVMCFNLINFTTFFYTLAFS